MALTLRLAIIAACLVPAASAWAEPLTKEQGDLILQELRDIRGLLERQQGFARPVAALPQPSAPVSVSSDAAMSIGAKDAPVVMVAFVDYQCPFCKRFDTETLPELRKKYIDTGKVRYVVRDLPLAFHENAQKAAEASYCAADQGKYWEMREKLRVNQQQLAQASLVGYAGELGISAEQFGKCLTEGRHAERVKKSLDEAQKNGIGGTPTFVIGKPNSDGTVTGAMVVGAQPLASFEQAIAQAQRGS